MKATVIQPAYCLDFSRSDTYFSWMLSAMDECDPSMDLIVLPEYSNVPCLARTKQEMLESYHKYSSRLLEKASETARRCEATLFVCCIDEWEGGLRNSTVVFNRRGERVGRYDKQHLVPSEMYVYELDKEYTRDFSEPTIIEVDGVKYAFLICYDFYFYENFANIARYDPDVVVACAYQRSDTHEALELMARFCAYNTNAYVVRASVSLGEDSPVGGNSMIVGPAGDVLLAMKNQVGLSSAEFDPHKRYLKAAGYGNPPATHHSYIESGRRPWKYRPAGSAIVRRDEWMPYPRLCAHRGFGTIAPENSLAAYGAAIALGAEEIEFDVWTSGDGVPVSIHDARLDRVSTGSGYVWEHTLEELKTYDFGCKYSDAFRGLTIPTLEQILQKLSCHAVMNVHVKHINDSDPLPWETVKEIVRLIDKYDCRKYCYIMSGNIAILEQFRALAPDLPRCAGADDRYPTEDLVEKAIRTGASRIQLYKPHFASMGEEYLEDAIKRAHENGIICNLFWSDDPEETKRYLDMGIDVVLTNDYQRNANVQRDYPKYCRK